MTKTFDYAMTHGGKFHADDVFSAALLKMTYPGIKIIRVFTVPDDFEGIVFDIGFGKFDHHQKDAKIRENGVPYAAFGLLWREFGESIIAAGCPPEQTAREAARFDERFIQPLDEDDNTGCGNQMAGAISTFNPSWDSDESTDQCFDEAVEFASVVLQKRLSSIMSINRAKTLVESALMEAKDKIVILPRFAPWRMILLQSDAEFVIYPSQRGGFSAQAIPKDSETKELRCAFPDKWAGLPADELPLISGIKTLTFCHKSCFLISADSMEDTVASCRLAMELQKQNGGAENRADPGMPARTAAKVSGRGDAKPAPVSAPCAVLRTNTRSETHRDSKTNYQPDSLAGFRTGIKITLRTDEV